MQAFSDAVQKGDAAAAWSLLSARTQKEADALAQKVSGRSGREMLFGSALPAGPVSGARVVSEAGDTAEVRTFAPDGGSAKNFHVVRENGRWRVDLALGR